MPILQFNDRKQTFQSYDFKLIRTCRLAAVYISLREVSERESAADVAREAGVQFASAFQTLSVYLNDFYVDLMKLQSADTIPDKMQSIIGIETYAQQLYNCVLGLIRKDYAVFLEAFGSYNNYLLANIKADLAELLQTTRTFKQMVQDLPHADKACIAKFIDVAQNPELQELLELRDFFNIYLVDEELKPKTSLLDTVPDTVREVTRIGAYALGSILGKVAWVAGVDPVTQDLEAWLKGWNDKHTKVELSASGVRLGP